jgi:thiol-disulfide isomerase/thioredoxin
MRLSLILVAVVALSAPVLSLHRTAGQTESQQKAEQLKPMPAIRLQDLNGKKVSTDQFEENIVLIDFWATWCVPCIAEVPFLNRLQEKFKTQGVKVIGVTLASGEAKEVKPFVTKFKMAYPILMGEDEQAYDLNIMGFPTSYLVTRDWKIYRKYVGGGPAKAQQIESDIQRLLEVRD